MNTKHQVLIYESERGWGTEKVDCWHFDSIAEAYAFTCKFNSRNTAATAPDWYMYAEYDGVAEVKESQ